MKLYLVQHGNSNPEEIDPEKNLSTKGKEDVQKVGEFIKNAGINVSDIFHSGKARAQQTAEILAKIVGASKVLKKGTLAPMDPIDDIKAEIASRNEDLMIIGHMPFLGALASHLLTVSHKPDTIAFQQGCVLSLEKSEGQWHINWMIVPDLL